MKTPKAGDKVFLFEAKMDLKWQVLEIEQKEL